MEISDICIKRNSSKLKVVCFCYFPVTGCKKMSSWSFSTHIYKEIVKNLKWLFFDTFLWLGVRNRVHGILGHIYTKNYFKIKAGSFLLIPCDFLWEGRMLEFSDTHIQRSRSKLKLVLLCNFPMTCCKKGGGYSFRAHIYKDIIQTWNWFLFVTFLWLVVRKGVDGVLRCIYTKK